MDINISSSKPVWKPYTWLAAGRLDAAEPFAPDWTEL